MMGHRYKARNGYEYDCVGRPGHRWRDVMAKTPGRWSYVKTCISRRIRRENKLEMSRWQKELLRKRWNKGREDGTLSLNGWI